MQPGVQRVGGVGAGGPTLPGDAFGLLPGRAVDPGGFGGEPEAARVPHHQAVVEWAARAGDPVAADAPADAVVHHALDPDGDVAALGGGQGERDRAGLEQVEP